MNARRSARSTPVTEAISGRYVLACAIVKMVIAWTHSQARQTTRLDERRVRAVPGSTQHTDKVLGMQESICRRDFLNAALLASGSLLMSSVTPAQLLAQEGGEWQ